MAQTVSLITAEDLLKVPSDVRGELIDGVLIEMSPPGNVHARVVARAMRLLLRAEDQGLGLAFDEGGFLLRRSPDTVRAPDAYFFRPDRVPAAGPPEGFWDSPPDLLVEVVSPHDTPLEIQNKLREWIEFGVRMVWIVYPHDKAVHVVRSLLERFTLTARNALDGGDVLPGFSCSVAELFE